MIDGNNLHAHVKIYSIQDRCVYCIDYDLRGYKEGETVDIKILKDSFKGEQINSTYGVVKNGSILANIQFLAGISGANSIQKNGENIIVKVPIRTTIGPDPYAKVREDAKVDICKRLDMLFAVDINPTIVGKQFIAEYSYVNHYYNHVITEVKVYRMRVSVFKGLLIPATIYDAYKDVQEYGPMPSQATVAATAVVSVLKFMDVDDGMPGTWQMV